MSTAANVSLIDGSVGATPAKIVDGGLNVNSKNFNLLVNMGKVPGYSTITKFGKNNIITTGTDPEDIWEFGGLYNFDADGTAPIQYLSSSDALDVNIPIKIYGLDINGNEVIQIKATDGQGVVTLDTPLWRVYRLENNGNTGQDLQGVLYCHIDPTPTDGVPISSSVRAIITNGNNQTLMALYTIPKGKVGFLYKAEAGLNFTGNPASGTHFAKFVYIFRPFGKVSRIGKEISNINVGSSNYQDIRSFPDIFPSLTDIRLNVLEVSDNMGVNGSFDILLIDETEFSSEYLTAIGQPV